MKNRLGISCVVDDMTPMGHIHHIKEKIHRDLGMKLADIICDASVNGEEVRIVPHGLDISRHYSFGHCTEFRLNIDVETSKRRSFF